MLYIAYFSNILSLLKFTFLLSGEILVEINVVTFHVNSQFNYL